MKLDFIKNLDEEDAMQFCADLKNFIFEYFKGKRNWESIQDLIFQWEQSAKIIEDDELMKIFDEARMQINYDIEC